MSGESHIYRTKLCNEIRPADIGQEVRLAGWVHNIRDLGGITFFELRDNYGISQLLIQPESPAAKVAEGIRKEFCITVSGTVQSRGEDNFNPELPTGEVDLVVTEIEILGAAEPLPFSVFPDTDVSEELRLKFRYLDLRRQALHENILLRIKIISAFRNKMVSLGFNEMTTPILTSSSPEGARDFIVPSRMHPGKFYALPQAPQQFKQLLMVAGFDRYFQIAPCFRDEDARADRSPGEFYQLDIEMSFATQDEIFSTVEDVMNDVFCQFVPEDTVTDIPFPRIPYREAMLKYGSDKPDLRNPLFIQDVSDVFEKSEFRAFAGKPVRVIKVADVLERPRSFFDRADTGVKEKGGAGASWILVEKSGEIKGPLAKFLNEEQTATLLERTGAKPGDGVFFYSSQDLYQLADIMGFLREYLGTELGLIEKGEFKFCWITDFPMYERDMRTGKIDFSHNPFSMPQGGMEALESMDPLDILAYQYDLVCNGVELSSGAIRNHRPDIMYRAFEIAGYSNEEVDKNFGGMIRAFKVGAPPHGGIAPGIDRIVMLIADQKNLRQVIAFPMSQTGQDLMMGAPSEVTDEQLRELHIELNLPAPKDEVSNG